MTDLGEGIALVDVEETVTEALLADKMNVVDQTEQESLPHKTFTISSYGADYTVDLLVKRVKNSDFFVPPFQRSFVWNMRQSSKFIESLLIGLPVPGVFVFRQQDSNRHLIIDGQQRLKSLAYFYSGKFHDSDRVFKLLDVQPQWEGKTYENLDDSDRRRLDDSIVHTTIFKQESPEDSDASVYEVFERINTGGVKLSPQEIRVCVNYGPITHFLRELNKYPLWRSIYGPISPRLKDEELILRFFAFYDNIENYERPLKGFLNGYMKNNRSASEADRLSTIFRKTIEFVTSTFGARPFRPDRALNVAVFDAISVGIARRIETRPIAAEDAAAAYQTLMSSKEFRDLYSGATADEANVKARFKMAFDCFESA